MISVEIVSTRIAEVRQALPVGIEHYVVPSKGKTYLNMRTNDQDLINLVRRMGSSLSI